MLNIKKAQSFYQTAQSLDRDMYFIYLYEWHKFSLN